VLENIEECKQPQAKVLEDIKEIKDKVGIQEFHLQEEIKRVDQISKERTDRRKLSETGRFFARKFYDKQKNKSSFVVRVARKVFGLDRAMKKSLNNKINSMLSDVDESGDQVMEILKSIQQGNSSRDDQQQRNTSFFESFFRRRSQTNVLSEMKIVQEAQIQLLAR